MRFLSIISFLFLFLINSYGGARTLRQVPQQYRTIQFAIDASRIGDTVLVAEGLYYENLRITKNIVLASRFILHRDTSHISRTIIDGSRAQDKRFGSTIFVKGSTDTTCVILGLTIRGGTGTRAAVPIDPSGEYWMVGGGICVQRAGLRIAYNHITRNTVRKTETAVGAYGAGIACFEPRGVLGIPPYVIIEHNLVTFNTTIGTKARYGGMSLQGPGVIRRNIVMHNYVRSPTRSAGGGIGLVLGKHYDVVADGNYIRGNSVGVGGGIQVATTSSYLGRAIIVNNIIADNEAYEVGGGIETTENSCAVIANNSIVGNRAGSHGDGIIITSGGLVTLINNILWKNNRQQLSMWTSVRLLNNLVDGGALGTNTIDADPEFVPGDSLFHLSPQSPAIGTGVSYAFLGGEKHLLPERDFFGVSRTTSSFSTRSLGAVEPSLAENVETGHYHRLQEADKDSHLRLLILIRQVSRPILTPDSQQVVQAGRHAVRLIAQDSVEYAVERDAMELTFTLPPGTNLLECEVSARGSNVLRTMSKIVQLEGHDEHATVFSHNRSYSYQRYANLLPGTYHLTVSGGDEKGFIDENNRRRVTIVVFPYWYQRWWAYGLLSVLVAGFVVIVFRRELERLHREKRLRQEFTQKQLESQEAERNRLASELHDGLGQNLLVVKNELQQLTGEHNVSQEDLQRVTSLAQESLESVREIASNLHPHHIEFLGFRAAVDALVKNIANSSGLKMEFSCDKLDRQLSKETEIHIYRIIQEGLSNIIRHASAHSVRVEIRTNPKSLDVIINDDGHGFDVSEFQRDQKRTTSSDIGRGFGLASMRERARIIGGTLTIESLASSGTTIHLTLPMT
jgi:signal transduction histidine kinase